jgi:3-phenylpropionate/trans-cinnamate dioxygenase ferredoxin subunit
VSPQWTKALPSADISDGSSVAKEFDGVSVLFCRSQGRVFAVANRCSHADSPLVGGRVRNCFIACPVHGQRFNLRDGSTTGGLTKMPIKVFPVTLEDDWVLVDLQG